MNPQNQTTATEDSIAGFNSLLEMLDDVVEGRRDWFKASGFNSLLEMP